MGSNDMRHKMRKHAGEIGAKICAKRSDKSNVKKNKF
jgi:hypothetical protein